MAEDSLGMKASGICLAPLLGYGIPASQTVDSMIKDIDNQLLENQSRLKECVLELMELSQNVSGMEEKFTNPAEAMAYIGENRLFDKDMCFDLDSEAVNKLLRNVLQMMEKNPGCEEKVLKQLYELCAAEGIAIPYRPSGSDATQSVVSINTAVDSSEQASDKLWNDICMKMKQYYTEELKKLPFGETRPVFSFKEGRAIHCVQSLCSLIAKEKVWSLYHNIRVTQLNQCIQKCIGSSTKSKKTSGVSVIAEQFSTMVGSVVNMMDDDFELFSCGMFSNVISPMTALSEIYSDALLDIVSGITSQVLEEIGSSLPAKSPKVDKKKKEDKEMSKSPSDMGFLGHIKVGIMKPQSRSADNLLDDEDQQFSDLQVLPGGYLEPIVKFVEQLLVLNCHIDKLHNTLIWQTLGRPPLKTKGKRVLKSVLKVNTSNEADEMKKQAFSPRSFEQSGLLPGAIPPPFGATPGMIGLKSESVNAEDVMVFEWRRNFARLAPDLAKTVENHINSQTERALKHLDDFITKHCDVEMVKIAPDLVGGRLDYPVMVAKCINDLLTEIKWLLPLAKAGPPAPFHIVRAGFIDAMSVNLKNVNVKLTSISNEVGTKLPYSCQYCVLATLAFIRNQILSVETALDNEQYNGKKAFPTLYSQYCQGVDALSRHIIERHNNILMTSILHDAESNFWNDSKEFYEGERCSFSIHMWYSHLMALRHDLWMTCPPKLSQTMFTAVLQESLSLLCQRYAHIKPSFRRTPQFKGDITAILLCASELLYYGTSVPVRYLDPVHTHQEHYNIHVYCSMLLSALVVVAAPVDNIYKVYKKGFKKRHSHSDDEKNKGYVSHWLSWIRPELFPLGCISPDSLQTTSALYLQLRLLFTKPEPNWVLLLQSLLMKEYTLPIMILSRVAVQHSDSDSGHPSSPGHSSQESNARRWSGAASTGQVSGHSNDKKVTEIFTAFLTVILQCTDFVTAVTKIMVPVFDRSDSWDVFDVSYKVSKLDQLPPWLSAICHSLESFALRVISPGVHVILARHNEPVGTEPIALRLKQLPCGCPTAHEPPIGNKGNKDILAEALYSTIMQLVEDVYTLPTSIVMFFKAAQRHVAQLGINTPQSSLGIKVLAICLKLQLSNIKNIEKLVGKSLDSEVTDELKMLAECVYHVLCAASYGKGSGTPRLAGMFMKANKTWVSEQLDVLMEHFNNESFDLPCDEPLHDVPAEFEENLLMSQASTILSLEKGEENLRKVYNMICNNRTWILSQLDVKPILGQRPSPWSTQLTFNLDPPPPEQYSPLEAYCWLGDVPFDQAAVFNFPWDWSALLHSDLGLSQVGFRSLLFNRHEMQDDAYLEENEKKPVESLRRKFHADSPEL